MQQLGQAPVADFATTACIADYIRNLAFDYRHVTHMNGNLISFEVRIQPTI